MDLGLREKVALVAAASQGLGRAVAEELAAEGASLVLCARGEKLLNETCDAIREKTGSHVIPVAGDLSVTADVERIVGGEHHRILVQHHVGAALIHHLLDDRRQLALDRMLGLRQPLLNRAFLPCGICLKRRLLVLERLDLFLLRIGREDRLDAGEKPKSGCGCGTRPVKETQKDKAATGCC